LKVIRALSDEIVVMRAGKVVERGSTQQIITEPREKYTRELMAAAFDLESGRQKM
jgi:ABC-type microcin C transport system duplicated ATPase subunit YejF